MKRHVLIVGTSQDPGSRSQLLAREAQRQLEGAKVSNKLIDLRELELTATGRKDCWEQKACVEIRQQIAQATHVLLAVPIYNFGAGSPAKGLIELVGGKELTGKTVGFLVAAGGPRSYMAVLGLANSLMLDFRCWIVPRFVYATGEDFEGDQVRSTELLERIGLLTREMFEHEMGE
jgi:NAD(P)H-dependent FMN reductase